jgi:glycosyltransferase involved in cell wall biosynthesis
MHSISLVIISFNEEANIADCIRSVEGVCEEILVLDSFSTDRTREIAASMGATVLTHEFDVHIQQNNRAKDLAKNNWVLSLDADERLSEKLKRSISNTNIENAITGYTMNRLNHYCGKPIKTCGWYPDRKLRLWHKQKGAWGGVNPHDRFELAEGEIGHLSGDILHFTYESKDAMVRQVQKFAHISAKYNVHRSVLYLLFKMYFSSCFKFLKTYFYQLGFTSGQAGLEICYYQAYEVFMKYSLALKLKNESVK